MKCTTCRSDIHFWAWKGTPVSHEEFHLLMALAERMEEILNAARARAREW
jgi:hypothetical protein